MRIEVLPVPEVDNLGYFSEPKYRVDFQPWLNQAWEEKDEQNHQLMIKHGAVNTDSSKI